MLLARQAQNILGAKPHSGPPKDKEAISNLTKMRNGISGLTLFIIRKKDFSMVGFEPVGSVWTCQVRLLLSVFFISA